MLTTFKVFNEFVTVLLPFYGLVFWLSCAVGAGAIALFVWAIFVELANDTWGGLVLALLVVEGGIYLILLIARTCAGL